MILLKPGLETNQLQLFKRRPSDLRKYRKYIADIKSRYGSVMNFILKERVRWADVIPRGEPFQCSGMMHCFAAKDTS